MTAIVSHGQFRRLNMQTLVNVSFFVFVACGAIAFVEPSPYDFASLICIPLWFIAGFRIHWMFVPFAALMILYNLAGFVALVPYWRESDPVMFMLQSFYLLITALFFALFFAERTIERGELALKAFAASNVIASGAAILGYLNVAGLASIFMNYERAQGTFKDPNVLGSFVIMGALYCIHLLMLGRTQRIFLTTGTLIVILSGIFLSFSRGSWVAFIISTAMMVALTFVATPDRRLRRRMLIGFALAAVCAGVLIAILLSFEPVRELFFQRAQGVGAEYDDPRFFNQLRSLPMLLERPLGFGPLRFRLIFDLEPHSSYVNAFASYGWIGGFLFLIIVATTSFIGFRLCFVRSPYRGLAQVVWPALLGFLIQGFQIDIDHWRHVFLMIGAIWGFEAARVRWLEGLNLRDPDASDPSPAVPAYSRSSRAAA